MCVCVCVNSQKIAYERNHDYLYVSLCHPYNNKFISSMIIILMYVMEWFLRWFTSMKCIANMYESSGNWTSCPSLVGEIKWCYDEVEQVHLGIFVWIGHGEQLSPWFGFCLLFVVFSINASWAWNGHQIPVANKSTS